MVHGRQRRSAESTQRTTARRTQLALLSTHRLLLAPLRRLGGRPGAAPIYRLPLFPRRSILTLPALPPPGLIYRLPLFCRQSILTFPALSPPGPIYHLPLFPRRSILTLPALPPPGPLRDVLLLWAPCAPPQIVPRAAASLGNASTVEDQRATRSVPAPSERRRAKQVP